MAMSRKTTTFILLSVWRGVVSAPDLPQGGAEEAALLQGKAKIFPHQVEPMRDDDHRCPEYDEGTVAAYKSLQSMKEGAKGQDKAAYYEALKKLDIEKLYHDIAGTMRDSQDCWPADGGDTPSYAGLFERLAWHCSGTFRLINGKAAGGCEGGRQRFFPENQWEDNVNNDKTRALLAPIKRKYDEKLSWGDLMTFAGTVAIKASGGPAKKFCFGRVDDADGSKSIPLGVEGTNGCPSDNAFCKSDAPCPNTFQFPEQDPSDYANCNVTQENGRFQGSHKVGLIYVHPQGPQLAQPPSPTYPSYFDGPNRGITLGTGQKPSTPVNPSWVHQRSPELSAREVRDTFKVRMGWTDQETVALIAGGHTLGRTHGNCDLTGTKWAKNPYVAEGPYFEAVRGSGAGPTDGTCGTGKLAGKGPNTISSGFEGPWTTTPSQWSYNYLESTLFEAWEPIKSPFGNDQWWTTNRSSPNKNTIRLTSDLALGADPIYRKYALEYARDHDKFDSDFADAFFKLMHRSQEHPHEDDLEADANVCTDFSFLSK